jgi:protein phosphatase
VPATFWGVFIGSVIVTVLLYFLGFWQISLLTGVVSLAAVGYLVSRLIKNSFQGKHGGTGQVFGKGPYVRLGCASSGQFAKQLADMLRKLQEGALRENWKVDWPQLKSMTGKAEQATSQEDHSTAIANYGRAVSFLMDQLRNQEDASSSSIEL